MKKTDLIIAVASHSGSTQKQTAAMLTALQNVVADTLAEGEDVVLTGFLTFKPVTRRARAVRNPRTGEMSEVPARGAVRVTPSAVLVRSVFEG